MGQKDRKTSNLKERIMQIVWEKHPETVKQLVELVHQEHPLPRQEIMDHILDLENQGRLTFKKNTTLTALKLKGYLSSSHSYWYWAITVLALTTTTAVFSIPENAYPIVYARYLLGSIFLFLPGFSLIKALFPTKELDNIERTALSMGLSLALVPIIGLLLNYTPWGIRVAPVTISLFCLTVVFSTIALVRKYNLQRPKDRALKRD